ncbi:TetR/AcrR family transcriptional regulator [uncultured Jatrophihabitans sp.]|uniref:TetR/AcrR family transcriptional regulator n=1 Tax=uncultured Jatrophihabitans sp. TaxID=1610747 RepID=UPI0035CB366F
MNSPSEGNAGGRATRERILLVAERLFARRGIEAVSMREILEEAGQRNKSAAQYHFGGKDGLVTAVLNFRLEAINHRRTARLDDIEAAGLQSDLRELAAAVVCPLAETLDDADNHFAGLLVRWHLDQPFRNRDNYVDPVVTESYRRIGAMLRHASGLSGSGFDVRYALAIDMTYTALAVRHASERSEVDTSPERHEFVRNLVDAVHGIFASPNYDG